MPRITHGVVLISPSATPQGHKHLAVHLRQAPALSASSPCSPRTWATANKPTFAVRLEEMARIKRTPAAHNSEWYY